MVDYFISEIRFLPCMQIGLSIAQIITSFKTSHRTIDV